MEFEDVVEGGGKFEENRGDVVHGFGRRGGCVGDDAGVAAVLEDGEEVDAADGEGDEGGERGFLPGVHKGLSLQDSLMGFAGGGSEDEALASV